MAATILSDLLIFDPIGKVQVEYADGVQVDDIHVHDADVVGDVEVAVGLIEALVNVEVAVGLMEALVELGEGDVPGSCTLVSISSLGEGDVNVHGSCTLVLFSSSASASNML